MKENGKKLCILAGAFLFLCLISQWRQPDPNGEFLSFRYPVAVYCGYLLLLTVWGISIYLRISQTILRHYLYLEIGIMALWFTVRVIQETLIRDLYALRLSGYFIAVPLVLLPLYSFYGVLGLDRGPDYRMRWEWKLLQLPAAGLILLMLTNEWHHAVFLAEPEVSISFHPNIGIFFIALWVTLLELARLALLIKKTRRNKDYPRLRFLPFVVAAIIGVMFVPYFISAFTAENERIELAAKHYFLETVIWEICIWLGIVPVNSQYGRVLEYSTVAMQITDPEGQVLAASRQAPVISQEQFAVLQREHRMPAGEGRELCLHRIPGGNLIWLQDYSAVSQAIQGLQQTAEELQQESDLLRRELEAKSEETRLQAQNTIYDQLNAETAGELALLDRLLRDDPGDPESWRRIGLLGTYVKRLCNLRLTYQENGVVDEEDLRLSLQNILDWLDQNRTEAAVTVQPLPSPSADLSFMSMKMMLRLLELLDFRPERFFVTVTDSLTCAIRTAAALAEEPLRELLAPGWQLCRTDSAEGVMLEIRKGNRSDENNK